MIVDESINRARIVEIMALMIARHRMGDRRVLPIDTVTARDRDYIITDSDRLLVLRLVQVAAPLYPLPQMMDIANENGNENQV